jgi:hypothetical protein
MTTEERFEKIESAIRDLIVVSRTLLESQQQTTAQMQQQRQEWRDEIQQSRQEWREAHRDHDEKLKAYRELAADTERKLNALIEIVDVIIRRKNDKS